jgi:hypothetical protein
MKSDFSTSSFIHGTHRNGEKMQKPTKDKDCVKTTMETNEYEHKEVIAPFQSNPGPASKGGGGGPCKPKWVDRQQPDLQSEGTYVTAKPSTRQYIWKV